MKRIILSLGICLIATLLFASCTASRGSNAYGGCKMTQGMVGYR